MRKIIRLKFTTPLHISNVRSDYGLSEKVIHSDTIYSALIDACNSLGFAEFIYKLEDNTLKFAISSLFPYYKKGDNEIVYFLPRPLSFNPAVSIDLHKKAKKIEYIEAKFFKNLQKGVYVQIDENKIKFNLLTDENIKEPLFTRSVIPRVRVPRAGGDSQPFYTERIYFNENAGLYFFIEYDENEVFFEVIEKAIKYLGYEGIGTDRNIGNGKFTYEVEENADIICFNDKESEYSLNLSLYIPENYETIKNSLDDKSYFSFLTRGGWITTFPYHTLRKKYVRAIAEGSVLKIGSGIKGKIVDITPDKTTLPTNLQNIHKVFRVGKAIWVPFKL